MISGKVELKEHSTIVELKESIRGITSDQFKALSISQKLFALKIHELAVKSISNISQGRNYPRGKDKKHTASKPGDPPNVDTGDLIQSVQVDPVDEITFLVGSNLEYAPHLEFGTREMAARPWLLPAVRAAQKSIGRRAYVKNANIAIKKSSK